MVVPFQPGDRRHQSFESLTTLGQFSRKARAAGVDLDPDMMRYKPDDPLGICVR
jgi:hypothetical protein